METQRLSDPQRRALSKLKSAWQTKRAIGERRCTLDALVDRRLANRATKYEGPLDLLPVSIYRVTLAGTEHQNNPPDRREACGPGEG